MDSLKEHNPENSGSGKLPTAWGLWLHPMRYSRLMREKEEENSLLRSLLERSEEQRLRVTDDCIPKSAHEAEKELMREEYSVEVGKLQARISELEGSLSEWKKTEEELREFSSELERFEELKEKYEVRIKGLKEKLRLQSLEMRDARLRCGAPDEPLELLDGSLGRARGDGSHDSRDGRHQRSLSGETDSSELLEDFSSGEGRGGKIAMCRDPRNRRSRRPKDDTDWLLPLP